MNKKIIFAVSAAVCLYLDSILFARLFTFDILPSALLAATVSLSILNGPRPGALFGGITGLLLDMLANTRLGFSAAMFVGAGLAAGFFQKKYYADNIVVPALTASVLFFIKELIMAAAASIGGGRFSIAAVLLRSILPGAVCCGALCALFHLVLKPLMARQVKRRRAEKPAR
ncbi:MAG: rod shape-determining protein MreD [Clostridiales bacterium]|jgi:rod shape-determining protein MreD|nr:rod shape-determining protein MreD [Clostridiales bacterium]